MLQKWALQTPKDVLIVTADLEKMRREGGPEGESMLSSFSSRREPAQDALQNLNAGMLSGMTKLLFVQN